MTSGTVNANQTFVQPDTIATIDETAAPFSNYTATLLSAMTNRPGDGNKNSDSQVYTQA